MDLSDIAIFKLIVFNFVHFCARITTIYSNRSRSVHLRPYIITMQKYSRFPKTLFAIFSLFEPISFS